MSLNPEQARIHAALMAGESAFVSGPGGVGKSYLIRKVVEDLRYTGKRVQVTALTGVAAVEVGGRTTHSALGIGIARNFNHLRNRGTVSAMQMVQRHPHFEFDDDPKYAAAMRTLERLSDLDVLVIDEISMASGDWFTMVDRWMRLVREVDEPFGGVQVVVSGDHLQLPPIEKQGDAVPEHRFSFESPSWAFPTHELKQVMRSDDPELHDMLMRVRMGDVDRKVLMYFNRRVRKRSSLDLANSTILYTTNRDVNVLNEAQLQELPGQEVQFVAKRYGSERQAARLVQEMQPPEVLVLKRGARVMICKNDPEAMGSRFINGDMGRVLEFTENAIRVELLDGRVVDVPKMFWERELDSGKVVASVSQYPLRLAYAITTHKSQGRSLAEFAVDLPGS